MAGNEEAGMLKQAANKVTDMVGGLVGQAGAATTMSADGFVENAAIGDLYEIESSRIALERTKSDKVRHLARQMISDHLTSTHQLGAALEMNETRGVAPPPATLDTRRKTMIKHLRAAPDESFDKTWLDQQVMAHEENVALMGAYGAKGENSQLRSFAMSTAPVVERHLEHMMGARAALAD